MASEFQPPLNLDTEAELLSIDRVVLCDSKAAAEEVLKTIFPIYCDFIVVSSDGHYPIRPALKKKAFERLSNSEDIQVVVLGAGAVQKFKIKSQRLLILDDLLMQTFKKHPAERQAAVEWSPEQLAFLIKTFFLQWSRMPRLHNVSFSYSHFAEFDARRFDWKATLVGASEP